MKKLFTIALILIGQLTFAQVNTNQPTIIVVPHTFKGQDIRETIEGENGFNIRTVLARMKEAFDSRGFTTYDFISTVKRMETLNLFNSQTQTGYKEEIAKNSGADIYIDVELVVDRSEPNGTELKLIIEAVETATGRSLSNKIAASGRYHTNDINKLVLLAIDKTKDDFMNTLQAKFTDIVNNGRSIIIEFRLAQGSKINFNSEVGKDGDLLSEAIMDFMAANSFKNQNKKSVSTAKLLIYEDVRIPIRQQNGQNYPIDEFGRVLRKFLRNLHLSPTIEYLRGQIVVTIN
jgi:hypothetical protein